MIRHYNRLLMMMIIVIIILIICDWESRVSCILSKKKWPIKSVLLGSKMVLRQKTGRYIMGAISEHPATSFTFVGMLKERGIKQ